MPVVIHDPKAIAARIDAYRASIAAATSDLDTQIAAMQAERSRIIHQHWQSRKTFSDGLIYSATARCRCGAGLCYKEGKETDSWKCSAGMMADIAGDDKFPYEQHQAFPFSVYEIKSETQPSAAGATTRTEPIEIARD